MFSGILISFYLVIRQSLSLVHLHKTMGAVLNIWLNDANLLCKTCFKPLIGGYSTHRNVSFKPPATPRVSESLTASVSAGKSESHGV